MTGPQPQPPIPITILTGFLGSGKTTTLLSLLPQLPPNYKLCLLKNEFGDVAVDSQLASKSSISGVTELLNGCICCNLVGQLSDSLIELRNKYNPDRIVIETSGSAFPATLAMEVNRLAAKSTSPTATTFADAKRGFVLDGTVLVVDVENWKGYDDSSYTAKLQFKYTDVVILNKWEQCSERLLDDAVDRIRDLNDETPIVKSEKGRVDTDVVFGIDTALARSLSSSSSSSSTSSSSKDDKHDHTHSSEVDVLSIIATGEKGIKKGQLSKFLGAAPRDEVYRIKGVLDMNEAPDGHVGPGRYILNWAFGRWNFTPLPEDTREPKVVVNGNSNSNGVVTKKETRITVVLARGEGNRWKRKLESMLEGVKVEKLA